MINLGTYICDVNTLQILNVGFENNAEILNHNCILMQWFFLVDYGLFEKWMSLSKLNVHWLKLLLMCE